MNKSVFIIGAGGHAKVLIDALHASNIPIKGVLEKNAELFGKKILNELIASEEILSEYSPEEVLLVNAVGSTNCLQLRRDIFNHYKKSGYAFLSVIHPKAYVAEDVQYAEGCQIMAGCVIQPGCRMGMNVILNTQASIDHDCDI